jgi:hypothetical protein
MPQRWLSLGGPSVAAALVRSLTTEWDGVVTGFDTEPGGAVVVSVMLHPSPLARPPASPAWAHRAGPGPGQGWAVHTGSEPGDRFALCL